MAMWSSSSGVSGAAESSNSSVLNILFITADDMNWSMPGFMGGEPGLMPNLDRLAAMSHRFVNNRCAAPICQPSREAMFSGLFPHRSGGSGFTPLTEGTPTLPSILKTHGYFIAAIHKIEHMQPPSSFPWDFSVPGPDRNPMAYERDIKAAIDLAEQAGKPFYINCNIDDPHRPFYGTPPAAKMDGNQEGAYKIQNEVTPTQIVIPPILEDLPAIRLELSQYYNSVKRLDVSIGRILSALEDAGKSRETLVVFVSDHGMPFPFAKATCYDYGTRAPFVIFWPGMGPPRTFENLTSNIDVMPTLLDILNIAKPGDLDGLSVLPIIEGRSNEHRSFQFTEVNTVGSGINYAMRAIQDDRYALVFTPWADGKLELKIEAMTGLSFRAMVEAGKSSRRIADRVAQYVYGTLYAFYDLEADPGQRINLIEAVEHRDRITKMQKLLQEHMKSSGDPQLENFETYLAGGRPIVLQDPERYRLRS